MSVCFKLLCRRIGADGRQEKEGMAGETVLPASSVRDTAGSASAPDDPAARRAVGRLEIEEGRAKSVHLRAV